MIESLTAHLLIDCECTLGEGPVWDADRRRLVFLDITERRVHHATVDGPGSAVVETWELDERVGAIALRRNGGFALAVESGFRLLDADGSEELRIPVDHGDPTVRMNDGKCDPAGRFWAGSLSDLFTPGSGALWRLDPDLSVHRVLDGMTMSNGLGWSPLGDTFYYIDSANAAVDAFDFDVDSGVLSNRRRLITSGGEEGIPDGMTVDDEGCLWVSGNMGGAIRRYSPDGEAISVVLIPVTAVASCTFGGPARDQLLITSIAEDFGDEVTALLGWDEARMAAVNSEPHRGAVFACGPGVTGPAPHQFAA
jgi:sugar lactone lactonase YvrE